MRTFHIITDFKKNYLSPLLVPILLQCCKGKPDGGEALLFADSAGNLHIQPASANGSVFFGSDDVTGLLDRMGKILAGHLRLVPQASYCYLFGGEEASKQHDSMVVFDGRTWTEDDNRMPATAPVTGAVSAVYRDHIFLLGGMDRAGSYVRMVHTFDGSSWSTVPPLATARTLPAIAVLFDKLYVMTGFTGSGGTRDVEVFDGQSWSAEAPLLVSRQVSAAAVLSDIIYVIGGYSDEGTLASVEKFNGTGWSPAPPLPRAVFGHVATVFQNNIYVMGGNNDLNQVTGAVQVFDGIKWTEAPSMPTQRYHLGAAVLLGRLYAVGGFDLQPTYFATVEVFDGEVWQSSAPLPGSRRSFAMVTYTPTPR